MLPAVTAVLAELQPLGGLLLVLGGGVVPPLAIGTLENDVVSHCLLFLFDDFGDGSGTDGTASFADSETKTFFHSDLVDKLHFDGNVITRHHHFNTCRKLTLASYVRSAEIELRAIFVKEWRVTTTFFL